MAKVPSHKEFSSAESWSGFQWKKCWIDWIDPMSLNVILGTMKKYIILANGLQ